MLFDPDNLEQLFNSMEYLYFNLERALLIGENGKKKAKKYFDYYINGKMFINFISNEN